MRSTDPDRIARERRAAGRLPDGSDACHHTPACECWAYCGHRDAIQKGTR